jgi:VWFA-related protein
MFRTVSSGMRVALVGFAGICFAVLLHGQTPASGVPPVAPTAAAAAATDAPSQGASVGITTFHAHSNLVVIDVVVSDSKGNPVRGLKAEDFTLMENNKQQTIKNFEEHTTPSAAEMAKLAPAPKLPVGLFTNQARVPESGPVNVLLLDYLNTPLTSQPYAREQLTKYINKAPAGTRIAIFALSTNLVMLQGFSSDPEVLKAALNSKKGAPQASAILTDPVNGGVQGNTDLQSLFVSDAVDAYQQLANIERAQALETSFEQDLRTKITLGAFDTLARYLVGIPGRKNVIWYSGSFPLSIEPQVGLQDAFDSVVRNDDEIRKTDNMLTRAQIAVYPVDARGLFNNSSNSAVNAGSAGMPTLGSNGNVNPASQSSSDATSQMAFMQQTAQEHETMLAMAEDTGGHAFINTNDLMSAVSQAISNGSNYYTVTYTPSNPQWDGRFRAIKMKVTQPGVKLAYRDGYYADDPNDKNRNVAGIAATAMSHPTAMVTAMMRGAPSPTEILFKVRIRPAAGPPEDTPVKDNAINPDPKVHVTGPYKQYGVDLVPDKSAITCPLGANGNRRCALEVSTFVYDKDGTLLVATTARRAAVLTASAYANVQVHGMAFHQQISVPVKGQYYLRTGIHDLNTDKVGAVEVPVASIAHLQPLQAPPPDPAATAAPAQAFPVMPASPVPAAAPATPAAATPAPAAPAATTPR